MLEKKEKGALNGGFFKMDALSLSGIKLFWLNGGNTHLDGGAMFGVVPKPLWSKKYPFNDNNQIELRTDPILIQLDGTKLLIESGIGDNKLTEKQRKIYGVTELSKITESLQQLGISVEEIDYVLMTHMHFDHASGLSRYENDNNVSVFPNAKIITSKVEWDEMREPNIRSKNTYWKENWESIQDQVETFEGEWSFGPIQMIHTGGHSDGHSIIKIETEAELLIHMADLMPTHAHQNPLWVMAYDDYPMTSISHKKKWLDYGLERNAWFSFYHDPFYRAVKWDEQGKVAECVNRNK